jgi:nucleotide-binding universal stress UspA family protein
MNILIPIDGSACTKRMLGYLAAHDELLGATNDITFLTVVPELPVRMTRFVDQATVKDYYDEEAQHVLDPVRLFADQQRWKFRAVHVRGHAADEIAAFAAETRPELLVMGTHGHSVLGNLVLGSVTTGVLARCKVPVLLIP